MIPKAIIERAMKALMSLAALGLIAAAPAPYVPNNQRLYEEECGDGKCFDGAYPTAGPGESCLTSTQRYDLTWIEWNFDGYADEAQFDLDRHNFNSPTEKADLEYLVKRYKLEEALIHTLWTTMKACPK